MKRANGTGSVVRLSGNRRRPYAVRASEKNDLGVIIQKTISYHRTAAEAQAALDEYNKLRSEGRTARLTLMDMTVGEVYEAWKNTRAYKSMKSASVASSSAAWSKRVSCFADRKIRSVTLDEWQAVLDEAEDAGMSQSTINNAAILMKALCQYACKRDIIAKDYTIYLDIPSVDVKNPRGSFDENTVKKIRALAAKGDRCAEICLVLCYTGFRISELLALRPEDYHPENGGYLQGGMKTAAGKNRIVPVHKKISLIVANWIGRDGETIFCDAEGKKLSSQKYRDSFADLMAEIGLDGPTPHWCRHTFATRMYEADVDALTIKWLMGHSVKSDITATYTHEKIDTLRRGIDKLP